MYKLRKGYVAVIPPIFQKVEARQTTGGFATIAQKSELAVVDLVMDCEVDGVQLKAGRDKILVAGDEGLQPWTKKKYFIGEVEFAMCPEARILGVQVQS